MRSRRLVGVVLDSSVMRKQLPQSVAFDNLLLLGCRLLGGWLLGGRLLGYWLGYWLGCRLGCRLLRCGLFLGHDSSSVKQGSGEFLLDGFQTAQSRRVPPANYMIATRP